MSGFTLAKVSKGGGGGNYEPLAAGKYDAVLHAIIALEMQKHVYQGVETGIVPKVLLLFEIPSELRPGRDGAELPAMLSYEMTLSSHEKSTFTKVVSALHHKALSEDSVYDIINSQEAIEGLLGKACTVDVKEYKNKLGQTKNAVKGIGELDKRLPQPTAVRDSFVFTAANPDLDIFKERLIGWTRDKLMSAVNADEFPAELHQAYRDLKEVEALNSGNKLV